MVPQPNILPPGAVPIERPKKSSRSSLDKGLYHFVLEFDVVNFDSKLCDYLTVMSPPPESLSGISLDTDSKASGYVSILHKLVFFIPRYKNGGRKIILNKNRGEIICNGP